MGMTDEELIARLRDACRGGETCKCSLNEAADRIEALVKERDKAALWATEQHASADSYALRLGQEKARAERLEEALRSMLEAAKFMYYGTAFEKDFRNALAALKGADHE